VKLVVAYIKVPFRQFIVRTEEYHEENLSRMSALWPDFESGKFRIQILIVTAWQTWTGIMLLLLLSSSSSSLLMLLLIQYFSALVHNQVSSNAVPLHGSELRIIRAWYTQISSRYLLINFGLFLFTRNMQERTRISLKLCSSKPVEDSFKALVLFFTKILISKAN
jgi:hypothetical protein